MIDGVSLVNLNVSVKDQDLARSFWTETMGFELVSDQQMGPERWIRVTPPDRSLVLVLSYNNPKLAEFLKDVPPQFPHSPVFFTCQDIQRTYEELTARGVQFPQPPIKMFFGWWALLCDPDGNRYALNQRDQ